MNNVNSPSHYTQGYIEAIYAIEQVLGKDGFKAFCIGNYLKYKMRAEHKGKDEDLKKAEVYLGWAVNGLPAPVDGRIPNKGSNLLEHQARAIAGVLQTKLLEIAPNWKVKSVEFAGQGTQTELVYAEVYDARIGRTLSTYTSEGERYEDIANRLIEVFNTVK